MAGDHDTVIDSGPSGTIATNSGTFVFHATESGSTFECKLDSGAFQSCSSPRVLSALADGAHTFSVRATDGAGHVDASPATRTFTVAVPVTPPPSDPPPSDPPDTGACDAAQAQLASAQAAMAKAKAKLKKAKSKTAKKKAKAAVKKAKQKVSAANGAVAGAC